jgi:hypothetical protein
MQVRLSGLREGSVLWAGLAAVALLACAGTDAPAADPDPVPLSDQARVAGLRVTLAGTLSVAERETLERIDVPMLVRLAALDWFEHESRFDLAGQVTLEVEVLALSLEGAVPVWLWRGLAGEDWLEVRVRVHDASGLHDDFILTERTGVEGWEWRDADARLDRMARRLGRRIAELL